MKWTKSDSDECAESGRDLRSQEKKKETASKVDSFKWTPKKETKSAKIEKIEKGNVFCMFDDRIGGDND
jgi:hypothetical protein